MIVLHQAARGLEWRVYASGKSPGPTLGTLCTMSPQVQLILGLLRAVDEERLMEEIEEHLKGLDT